MGFSGPVIWFECDRHWHSTISTMFSSKVETTVKVHAKHLKNHVSINARTQDGMHFFKCAESGWLARLLCKDGSFLEKALTRSPLMSTIVQLRDGAYRTTVGTTKGSKPNKRARVTKLTVEGSAHVVCTPTIAAIEGCVSMNASLNTCTM